MLKEWRIVDAILGSPRPVYRYDAGSWGPPEADALVGAWRTPHTGDECCVIVLYLIEVRPSAASVAERAAELLMRYVRDDIARHGRATLAMSGGRTPQRIFEILAATGSPWAAVDFFQVDERIAPAGHADRNATQAAAALAAPLRRHPDAFHWMPVEDADLDAAAQRYAAALGLAAGTPPNVGTVHLGLGADGQHGVDLSGAQRSPMDGRAATSPSPTSTSAAGG